jgi:hypothetical protein
MIDRRLSQFAVTVLVATVSACASSARTSNAYAPIYAPAGEPVCWAEEGKACQVSLVSLIADPTKYAGKSVVLIGFATLEFEGNAVYLSKEVAEIGDTANAVWLDIAGLTTPNPEKLNRRYVLVAGTFDAENRGHIGGYAGTLKSISRLEEWKFRR